MSSRVLNEMIREDQEEEERVTKSTLGGCLDGQRVTVNSPNVRHGDASSPEQQSRNTSTLQIAPKATDDLHDFTTRNCKSSLPITRDFGQDMYLSAGTSLYASLRLLRPHSPHPATGTV